MARSTVSKQRSIRRDRSQRGRGSQAVPVKETYEAGNPASGQHFRIYGHRGSPRGSLENTIGSFRLALEEGADGFETDLRRSADGRIVLFHDAMHLRQPVGTLAAPELRGRVGELAELDDLGPLKGRCSMILELKESGFEEQLATFLAGWPGVIVASFDHALIERYAALGGGGELGLTFRDDHPEFLARALGIGARWIFPRWSSVDESLVARYREAGRDVVPWSPNRSGIWARLHAWGCAGVITDLPRKAVLWRNAVEDKTVRGYDGRRVRR